MSKETGAIQLICARIVLLEMILVVVALFYERKMLVGRLLVYTSYKMSVRCYDGINFRLVN